MKSLMVAMVVVGMVACGNDDPPLGSGNGTCAQRKGSYIVKYAVRSGTCGQTAETVINVDTQPTAPTPPCTGTIAYSADNCEVTYDQTCPADVVAPGAKLANSGKSKWDTGAATGTAVENWIITGSNGVALCQGTYDVTITRQ